MRNSRLGLAIFLAISFHFSLLAQEEEKDPKLPKEIAEAYEAFDAEEYFNAVELLKDAYNEATGRDQKAEVLFKLAEAYRMQNEYKEAEQNYNKAIKVGYKDPVALLLRGDMLKAQGEYEEAIEVYQEYKKENPTDSEADMAIESTRRAIAQRDQPSQYQVDNMKSINSRAADFAVLFGGDRRESDVIYFVSSREESVGNDEDGYSGEPFMDLYKTQAERKSERRGRLRGKDEDEEVSYADLKWSTPSLLDEEEFLNTEHHEGTATYDSRKKELYFTRCIAEKDQELGCGLYKSEMVGQSWKEAEQVIIGGDTMANIGDPAFSADDKFLYFVSDDFNAKGGHDIFMTTFDRRTKTWKTPTNLGSVVNTTGSERFPIVHGDGYLYFASDGHPGMGGLDIYKIKLGEDGMPEGDLIHLEYPINSNADDFALVWEPGTDTKKGFLSSNRDGSAKRMGSSENSDDIWSVYRTPLVFNIEGVVLDSEEKTPVAEATVTMDGSDGSSVTITADANGYYIFDDTKVMENVNYKLSFSKKKYLSGTGDVSTIGFTIDAFEYVPSAGYFIKRILFNKELDPIKKPIVLPNVLFALAKWDLTPESMSSLDTVVEILNNNPNITIGMRSHTDYRDTDERNNRLSQRRADTCVSYLISKGIDARRLTAQGMGEGEPFVIPKNYTGYGFEQFTEGIELTEAYIKTLSPDKQEVANQINRRTDFKVLSDDYVPAGGIDTPEGVDPRDVIEAARNQEPSAGEIYVLTKKESFGAIANRYKMNMRDFKALNGGLRGVRPFEGLQLKVEAKGNYEAWDASHYQVQRAGEKLKDIAKKLGVEEETLEELNPNLEEVGIQPGLWIRYK